jgi:hypothetical protein
MQKSRYNLLIPDALRERIQEYKERMCLTYDSQAIIQLIRIGLETEEDRNAKRKWPE